MVDSAPLHDQLLLYYSDTHTLSRCVYAYSKITTHGANN